MFCVKCEKILDLDILIGTTRWRKASGESRDHIHTMRTLKHLLILLPKAAFFASWFSSRWASLAYIFSNH